MMPVKEILAMRHLDTLPPVLVIDETSIKCTDDAGPICGCDEKYDLINNYNAFLPGGVHPYNRRKIPDSESLEIYWKRLCLGDFDLIFEKPVAVHRNEIPGKTVLPKEPSEEELMFVRQPMYTKGYMDQKLKQCKREHVEGCRCGNK